MLADRYRKVRSFTMALAAPLSDEDCTVQSMPDASPTKWHLAHTTWFFETFVLAKVLSDYRPFDPAYRYLFNSYYDAVGDRHPRPRRGIITRPGMREIRRYREQVDAVMLELLLRWESEGFDEAAAVAGAAEGGARFAALLGIHHEEQHQELVLTDIQHAFFDNPLYPVYAPALEGKTELVGPHVSGARPGTTIFPEGIRSVGHQPGGTFAFDNEGPRHREFLESFELAPRLVTNGEYLRFIAERGYETPDLWLSDGWAAARAADWKAPLYWVEQDKTETPLAFSLRGLRPLDLAAPVCHVSYYEADAYARWAGARLPTESEWEVAAAAVPVSGNFVESGLLAPAAAPRAKHGGNHKEEPQQLFGDVWEWTASPYVPYPGFAKFAGALGEYNGKFMSNQMVLRGGSCVTSQAHIRSTYRNFFPPHARWQFSGIRLARSA